jgi:hypothetical protein
MLLQLLWGQAHAIAIDLEDSELFSEFAASPTCSYMIQLSLYLCAEWFTYSLNLSYETVVAKEEDFQIFRSTMAFFHLVQSRELLTDAFLQACIIGLTNIVVKQAAILRDVVDAKHGRISRFVRQRLGKRRAELLAGACCALGQEFSGSLLRRRSPSYEVIVPYELLAEFGESLLWLWDIASTNELQMKERLLVPVATAIVGLSGFSGYGYLRASTRTSIEFYDSDASAADFVSEHENGSEGGAGSQYKGLLGVLGQTVHAVNGTFSAVDEDAATSFAYYDGYFTKDGPLLPLVVARVLNRISDVLLVSFAEGDESTRQKAIWKLYPYRTRTIGCLLDTILYKTYKCLHLFVLSSNNDSKDAVAPSTSSLRALKHKPESLEAALSLYRCIMRAYSQGRKSPPKAALDAVLESLPPLSSEHGGTGDTIRSYLFSPGSNFSFPELRAILCHAEKWDLPFEQVKQACDQYVEPEGEEQTTTLVRRGLTQFLSQGALPEQGNDCDRSESIIIEEELSKKFSAILDTLCLGDPRDCQGWFKAAQCIMEKANLIADRIGSIHASSRENSFTIPMQPLASEIHSSLPDLLEKQAHEMNSSDERRVSSIGMDLSLYVRHTWSSFSSLQTCSAEVSSCYRDTSDACGKCAEQRVFEETVALFNSQDYTRWQQVWGGLFISSLRLLGIRCICLALYILAQKDVSDIKTKQMLSDCLEFLGIVLYLEVSGCQTYGHPISPLTAKRKRDLAEIALECFAKASANLSDDDDDRPHIWGLRFMQGKCHEKIASTLRKESYNTSYGDQGTVRRYEVHMKSALKKYAESLCAALLVDKKGLMNADQNGGSEHGPAEVIYRLHATRLKCLIHAANYYDGERDKAEIEALRLTEEHWYSDQSDRPTSIRERIWAVLTDVVDALAKCRLDHAYFHRSVYRHAQALLWAPILDDPTMPRASGGAGTVSALKAAKLRGFNSSDALSSAATTLSVLFERRRAQLCAVWVTTGSQSPFAILNQTVRKYDFLRQKYILAYLDILRMCNSRDNIESFMKSVYATGRDMPSFFAASATARGGDPPTNHSVDSLLPEGGHFFLGTIKRQANGCIAELILREVRTGKLTSNSAKESNLKAAYSCFLRLNCSIDGLTKSLRSRKFHRLNDTIKTVALCLIESFLQISSNSAAHQQLTDWSGETLQASLLHLALEHCKKLFPNLSGNYYSKKPIQKRKRKEPDDLPAEKSFDIRVPEGAKKGETFVVSVEVDGQAKKVRLTVPDPVPAIMRFSLPAVNEPKANGNIDTKKPKADDKHAIL